MAQPSQLCKQFAKILGAQASDVNGVCVATRLRTNLHPTILGKRTKSPLVIPQLFSFESMDSSGKALCLGETVILTQEINPFITALRTRGIKVTFTPQPLAV